MQGSHLHDKFHSISMTAKRVQGRMVPQPHQRSPVNRVGSKYLRKCTRKKKTNVILFFILMQQYVLLWVFVNSMCAITVIQWPTGLKSGCTKIKSRIIVWCCQPVWQLDLQSSWGLLRCPEEWFLFNHSFSRCMRWIFWLLALATPRSWTASLPPFLQCLRSRCCPTVKTPRGKRVSWSYKNVN